MSNFGLACGSKDAQMNTGAAEIQVDLPCSKPYKNLFLYDIIDRCQRWKTALFHVGPAAGASNASFFGWRSAIVDAENAEMPWLHSFQSVVELGFFPTMDRLTAASPETIFQRTLICWSTLALDWVEWVELVECGEQVDKAKHSACFVAKLDIAGSAQRQKGVTSLIAPVGVNLVCRQKTHSTSDWACLTLVNANYAGMIAVSAAVALLMVGIRSWLRGPVALCQQRMVTRDFIPQFNWGESWNQWKK